MFARSIITGITVIGALLLAACTQGDDMRLLPDGQERVAITFEASEQAEQTEKTEKTTRAGATGPITRDNYNLRKTGFGVFAATETGTSPDLMYNQEVEFTHLADGSDNGYWSYSPLKYWPNDQSVIDHLYFCAYAPYVDSATPAGTTGIIGMSTNNETTTPYIIYARAKELDQTVDLLWSYKNPTAKPNITQAVRFSMHHALARVAVSVGLQYAPAANTKVLIRRITLKATQLVTQASLDLTGNESADVEGEEVPYPTWDDHTFSSADADCKIMIDHNPTTTPASYGILDETVRYIDDLPYTWQPEGLPAPEADPLDPSDPEKNTPVFVNALSEDDNHKAYLYFIPQDNAATAADQALILTTCQIDYVIVSTSGTTTPGSKETTGTVTVANPLRGNRTYHLKLNLKLS